jgi:hypothetical protein
LAYASSFSAYILFKVFSNAGVEASRLTSCLDNLWPLGRTAWPPSLGHPLQDRWPMLHCHVSLSHLFYMKHSLFITWDTLSSHPRAWAGEEGQNGGSWRRWNGWMCR